MEKKSLLRSLSDYIAKLVFRQLQGLWSKDIALSASRRSQRLYGERLPVYDIVNAGSDHRFVCYGENIFEGVTVHNCLGLQYGMGVGKLADKLTGDMKRLVTEEEARSLSNLHKKIFKVMWAWQDKIERMYNRDKYLMLWGGWSILGDCDNSLSLRNAPVQGHGSVIMQEAVILAEKKGIQILSPLHDAIYAEADEENAEEQAALLADCMRQAVINVIGDSLEVRMDIDIHKSTDTWIEDKGRRWYEKLNKYLVFHESMGDREKSIVSKVLSDMVYENY